MCAEKEGGFEIRNTLDKGTEGGLVKREWGQVNSGVCVILIAHPIGIKCYSIEIPCFLCWLVSFSYFSVHGEKEGFPK